MTITTEFEPGDFVKHKLEPDGVSGMIIAFMVRGQNHSYQVQWYPDKEACWHLDFELLLDGSKPRGEIGFKDKP